MSQEIILLLGGARSGKSSYAEKLARELGERVLYVATAQAKDPEMQSRIQIHQQSRPAAWRTLETPTGVGPAVSAILAEQPMDVVLLDCLTLLVTNLTLGDMGKDPYDDALDNIDENAAQERINHELDQLLAAANSSDIPWIIVSNELGLGLVPEYPLGRLYRDLLGWANQRLAAHADRVFFMVAGLPLDLKALGQT